MQTNVLCRGVILLLAVAGGAPVAATATAGVLEDNLATTGPQIYNFQEGDKRNDSWVAIDYTPPTAVTVTAFRHHYIYNATPLKNQLNFQLFRGDNPGVGSLVATWAVPAAAWNEINTGWTAFGRPVYLCVVPFNPPRALSPSVQYWFAYQSENNQPANIVYWAFRSSIKGAVMWVKLGASERWRGIDELYGRFDGSYRLDGGYTGVAPASLGKVKALFR
jgi:hypothetical protein